MNPNDVFWLARYAHNTLAPLFAEVKAIEPSLQFHIEMCFADSDSKYQQNSHINVFAHWSRAGMLQQDYGLKTKQDIDKLANTIKDKIAGLKDQQEISALLESVSV